MRKFVATLAALPTLAMAHPSAHGHTHPEEMTGALITLVVVAAAYMLWKQNKD